MLDLKKSQSIHELSRGYFTSPSMKIWGINSAILGKFPVIQIWIVSGVMATLFKVLKIFLLQWVEKMMILSMELLLLRLLLLHLFPLLCGIDVSCETPPSRPVLRILLWQPPLRQVVPDAIQPPPLWSSSPSFPRHRHPHHGRYFEKSDVGQLCRATKSTWFWQR